MSFDLFTISCLPAKEALEIQSIKDEYRRELNIAKFSYKN